MSSLTSSSLILLSLSLSVSLLLSTSLSAGWPQVFTGRLLQPRHLQPGPQWQLPFLHLYQHVEQPVLQLQPFSDKGHSLSEKRHVGFTLPINCE